MTEKMLAKFDKYWDEYSIITKINV